MNRGALLITLLLIFSCSVCAQKLPVKTYGVPDGLPHEEVQRIAADSRGFLWFCTYDGLSRFDGKRFTTYDVNDGLPVASVNDLLESRDGSYWVATRGGGVARFDPDSRREAGTRRRLFKTYSLGSEITPNFVASLYEDRKGNIWAATNGGLFRLSAAERDAGSFRRVELKLPSRPEVVTEIQAVVEDGEGSMWIASVWGLARLFPSGRMTHYSVNPTADDVVFGLIVDRSGRLWIAHRTGLFVFKPDDAAEAESFYGKTRKLPVRRRAAGTLVPNTPGEAYWYTKADHLPESQVGALLQSNDGHIWIGTAWGGLAEFDGQQFHSYSLRQGVPNRISALTEDRNGNIWVATRDRGVTRITRNGLISYGEEEGITNPEVIQIYEGQEGELYAISSKWSIHLFDGRRFTTVRPNLPQHILDSSSGRWWIIQDQAGEWWVSTIEGLYRFPKVQRLEDLSHTPPRAVYTTRDGLPDNNINRLYEDSHGDIWISSYNPPGLLTRWERATGTFHRYSQAQGFPPLNWINAFEDGAGGGVWLGLHNGGLARYRAGRFEVFDQAAGVPGGIIQGLYQDRSGRLWIASSGGGAASVDDPNAARPVFRTYTLENGLSSNNLRSFVEDRWGRIYLGTAKGIDRLDPATGRIKHYTGADGLISSEVTAAFADRNGRLWFGTRDGVSSLVPAPGQSESSPLAVIRSILIDGVSQPVSEIGEISLSGLEIGPQQNGIQIEVLIPSFGATGAPRYQYRLEGIDRDWSPVTDQPSVSYAHLAPGSYRFLARAVTTEGIRSELPASVTFKVLPPIWQRWWFLALAGMAIGALVYGWHRHQIRRVVEIERVRMRIATDLHDDIGLNLSRMVILSEVVKQQIGDEQPESVERLNEIADSARGLVDSMSDIVWSIDPRRDDLNNLLLRIRQFAADVFDSRGINWDFQTLPELEKVKLDPQQRRQILLILKEALNNIARHANCSTASVAIAVIGNQLKAEIRDNGRGFESELFKISETDGNGGNGLKNMRVRASDLGGRLNVSSTPGHGTTITLMLPIK